MKLFDMISGAAVQWHLCSSYG